VETTCLSLLALQTLGKTHETMSASQQQLPEPPDGIRKFFEPPQKYQSDLGGFRSPLLFVDGTPVPTAGDWQRRRAEILATWHSAMGPWPPLIERPRVEVVNTTRRESITQQQLRIEIALGNELVDALLLVPDPEAPARKRPAVLVTYYDAETGVGLGAPWRDYGWQLAKRGFITLCIGKPNVQIDLTTTNKPRTDPYLGPIGKPVRVQPLSALAYAAANAHTVLAQRTDVQPDRIGIVGHSFGGKWAMFASCLYDKFAAAVWSDPGIVFDERDRRKQNPSGSVNYWDVWYLGFDLGAVADPQNAGPFRKLPSEGQPRTGAYKALVETGHDLIELHALMAPRPFLVSGGTADLPERWPALNHAIAVNKLLGFDHRVALTAREGHTPTAEGNEQVYRFFEWCLQPGTGGNNTNPASSLDLGIALGAESIDLTRDEIIDHIRGGWTGMLIGGIEGLAHEFKYIQQPRQELPDYTFLPQGARTDDDNDFEWTHLFFMDQEGVLKIPYPRLVEIWKANMNTGLWCANEQARKLMDKGIVPPRTADPSLNRFAPYNLAGQFCVESYGMIAPGMPQSAADLGLHYARVSVSGEPLQAAQYWTTLISLAAVGSEPLEELVKKSLLAVDPASAQAEAVREGINIFHQHPTDWKAARQYFHDKWYCPKEKPWDAQARPRKWNDNSTPLNGAMVVLALLYGQGDFYRTGQYAMALGYDADCNAATACAVVGTCIGFSALEKLPQYHMPDRYQNLTRPQLPRESKVSDQAALMLRLSEKLIVANGGQAITIDGKPGYRIQLQSPRRLE